ncbi:MAG TPA: amidohydrolase family protein [Candidatus Cybelea sp.]|nr:amidohydrolase family protein [Candidatus Cybelea sp.]
MPDFPIVDAHVHLADPKRFSYAWTKNAPSLNRTVRPADLMKAAAPVKIETLVFVEVDVDMPQHVAEAEWIDGLAEADPRIGGMVAALPLERGRDAKPELDRLLKLKRLRGIRRLIQNQADPDFCIKPGFIEGLRLLAPHDLVFDICIFHHHLPNAIKMVRRCPEVRFVLDHIGKPAIKAGIADPWRQHMKELSSLPNVTCKISGVSTEADHKNWTREQLKPYILHAIECFGFERVLYGGDWHVLELAGTYPQWIEVLDWVIEGASAEEKRKLYRENAIRIYRLGK